MIQNNIEIIKTNSSELKQSYKLLARLNQHDKPRLGLDVDEISGVLKDLGKHYNILDNIEIKLSPPIELPNIYKANKVIIVSSDLTLKFSGLSDEYIFQFIDTITENLPGFVNIEKLTLTKKNDLDSTKLDLIAKGNLVTIVDCILVLRWQDFKDIL